MRKLLLLPVLLVIALVVFDIWTRVAMQNQLASRIDSYVPNAHATVAIHAFPWLPTLARSGRVNSITAHANQVSQGDFVLNNVEVTVNGVRINRHLLVDKHQLEIVSITQGTATADMTQANLSTVLGVPVTLGNGTVQTTIAGLTVHASVSVHNSKLELGDIPIPISIPVPMLPVLPCLGNATIMPGRLALSCTFTQIPEALKAALQTSDPQQ